MKDKKENKYGYTFTTYTNACEFLDEYSFLKQSDIRDSIKLRKLRDDSMNSQRICNSIQQKYESDDSNLSGVEAVNIAPNLSLKNIIQSDAIITSRNLDKNDFKERFENEYFPYTPLFCNCCGENLYADSD